MSFPRKKLDMGLLILEERSCEVITACAKRFHPDWSFERFEAIQCNAADALPSDGNRYDDSYIFHIAGPSLDVLDREVPFLFPLERGTHYLWELFTELPRSGGSRSSRQFWNRLARAMSGIALPITTDELVAHFEQASLALLANAVDMGDRFYIPDMDYGGWNGGIVSKDFLIAGLKMLAAKLDGPVRETHHTRKPASDKRSTAEKAAETAAEMAAKEAAETAAKEAAEKSTAEKSGEIADVEAKEAADAGAKADTDRTESSAQSAEESDASGAEPGAPENRGQETR